MEIQSAFAFVSVGCTFPETCRAHETVIFARRNRLRSAGHFRWTVHARL
jgi:hypothetical protein